MEPHSQNDSGACGAAAGPQLRIGILAERRYLSQSQPSGMIASLRALGHQVMVIDPEAAYYELNDAHWLTSLNLVVARGRSWAVLCLLNWAEARGIPTVNQRAAIAAVHNKAEMAVALTSADVPTPLTLLGPTHNLARGTDARVYPLVIKPVFGDNGRGLHLVNNPQELAALEWPEPFALAQQFVPGNGYDLKLYAIGDEIWAVRKPSMFDRNGKHKPSATLGKSPRAELLPLSPDWEELARRCGRLFGLELYGLDCMETPNGPVVIEVNEFPNYTGVPGADEKLAEYIVCRAQGEKQRGRETCESVS